MSAKPLSKQEYLATVLAPETLESAFGILALRARFMHADAAPIPAAGEDPGPDREHVARALATLTESFHEMGQVQIEERLAAISCDSLPDLERFKKRLARVADQSFVLQTADEDAALDQGLWKIFKRVLIAPQRQATEQKQKTLQTLSRTAVQKRTAKFVKRIKRDYPELYQLESDWMDKLTKGKKIAKDSRRPANMGLGCLGAYGVFYLISRLVRMLLAND